MFKNKEDYEKYVEKTEQFFEDLEQQKKDIHPLIKEYFEILYKIGEVNVEFYRFHQPKSGIYLDEIEFDLDKVSVIFSVNEGRGLNS